MTGHKMRVIGGHMDGKVVELAPRHTRLCSPLMLHTDGLRECPVHTWRRTPSCWIWEGPTDPDPNPFPHISLFRRSVR